MLWRQFLIYQIKVIDMSIIIECIIGTEGRLFMKLWVSLVGSLIQRAYEETANQSLLLRYQFFKGRQRWTNWDVHNYYG